MGTDKSSSKKRLTSNGSKSTKSSEKKKEQSNTEKGGCMRKISAILTRALFALHSGIALWRVSFDYPTTYLYFLSIGLVCLLFEMVFTLAVRQGKEYKWFCPSVLFYLMSVVPCLWLLELTRLDGAMYTALQAGYCNDSMKSVLTGIYLQPQISPQDNSSLENNRSRRSLYDNLLLIDYQHKLDQSQKLLKRIRRQLDENSKPKEEKRKRKENRRRKLANKPDTTRNSTQAFNGTISTPAAVREKNQSTLANSTIDLNTTALLNETTIPQFVTSDTSSSVIYTRSTTSSFLTTPVSNHDGEGKNDLDEIGQKIKDGFSSIEKETANIFNKTKEVITQLNKMVDGDTWILLLHQVLLFVLVIGRWLLPKGEITRDQLSQLLLVFIGVGADILEFVTETLDNDEINDTSCSMTLHYVIYGVWSWSLLQFTLVLTASKSRKTRIGFETAIVVDPNRTGCCANSLFATADLWGILVTLFLQDVPFLATRLYILIVYNLKSQMMIFFTGKNALVVILQIYRIIVLKLSLKKPKEESVDQSEMEPLRGTLVQLARRATVVTDNGTNPGDDIRDATFKRIRDGSMVVKIHLEGEETLRKKRKKSAVKT